jgi:hypothetical protein
MWLYLFLLVIVFIVAYLIIVFDIIDLIIDWTRALIK